MSSVERSADDNEVGLMNGGLVKPPEQVAKEHIRIVDSSEEVVKEDEVEDAVEKGEEVTEETGHEKEEDVKEDAKKEVEESEPNGNVVEEWMDILGTGQLKKKVLKAGEPDTRPLNGHICSVSYVVQLEDGTEVERNNQVEVHVGDGDVPQGVDLCLALMDVGEEALIVSSPRFAYGSVGNKPSVPPDATINFTVTLHEAHPEPFISELSLEERIRLGLMKKARGNWWCGRDDHPQAIISYRKALHFLDDTQIPENHNSDVLKNLIDERLNTYNNLALMQMKTGAYDAALLSVNHVLVCQPNNIKALYRKATCHKKKGNIEESIAVLRKALSIAPEMKNFQQELSVLLAKQRELNATQRNLYKKMMGNMSNQGKSGKEARMSGQESKSNNRWRWLAIGSFAVVLAGMLAVKYKF